MDIPLPPSPSSSRPEPVSQPTSASIEYSPSHVTSPMSDEEDSNMESPPVKAAPPTVATATKIETSTTPPTTTAHKAVSISLKRPAVLSKNKASSMLSSYKSSKSGTISMSLGKSGRGKLQTPKLFDEDDPDQKPAKPPLPVPTPSLPTLPKEPKKLNIESIMQEESAEKAKIGFTALPPDLKVPTTDQNWLNAFVAARVETTSNSAVVSGMDNMGFCIDVSAKNAIESKLKLNQSKRDEMNSKRRRTRSHSRTRDRRTRSRSRDRRSRSRDRRSRSRDRRSRSRERRNSGGGDSKRRRSRSPPKEIAFVLKELPTSWKDCKEKNVDVTHSEFHRAKAALTNKPTDAKDSASKTLTFLARKIAEPDDFIDIYNCDCRGSSRPRVNSSRDNPDHIMVEFPISGIKRTTTAKTLKWSMNPKYSTEYLTRAYCFTDGPPECLLPIINAEPQIGPQESQVEENPIAQFVKEKDFLSDDAKVELDEKPTNISEEQSQVKDEGAKKKKKKKDKKKAKDCTEKPPKDKTRKKKKKKERKLDEDSTGEVKAEKKLKKKKAPEKDKKKKKDKKLSSKEEESDDASPLQDEHTVLPKEEVIVAPITGLGNIGTWEDPMKLGTDMGDVGTGRDENTSKTSSTMGSMENLSFSYVADRTEEEDPKTPAKDENEGTPSPQDEPFKVPKQETPPSDPRLRRSGPRTPSRTPPHNSGSKQRHGPRTPSPSPSGSTRRGLYNSPKRRPEVHERRFDKSPPQRYRSPNKSPPQRYRSPNKSPTQRYRSPNKSPPQRYRSPIQGPDEWGPENRSPRYARPHNPLGDRRGPGSSSGRDRDIDRRRSPSPGYPDYKRFGDGYSPSYRSSPTADRIRSRTPPSLRGRDFPDPDGRELKSRDRDNWEKDRRDPEDRNKMSDQTKPKELETRSKESRDRELWDSENRDRKRDGRISRDSDNPDRGRELDLRDRDRRRSSKDLEGGRVRDSRERDPDSRERESLRRGGVRDSRRDIERDYESRRRESRDFESRERRRERDLRDRGWDRDRRDGRRRESWDHEGREWERDYGRRHLSPLSPRRSRRSPGSDYNPHRIGEPTADYPPGYFYSHDHEYRSSHPGPGGSNSPLRPSLDERLEKELGIKVQQLPNQGGNELMPDYTRPPPGYLPAGQRISAPLINVPLVNNPVIMPEVVSTQFIPTAPTILPNLETHDYLAAAKSSSVHVDKQEEGKLVRIGNMLQIVPDTQATPFVPQVAPVVAQVTPPMTLTTSQVLTTFTPQTAPVLTPSFAAPQIAPVPPPAPARAPEETQANEVLRKMQELKSKKEEEQRLAREKKISDRKNRLMNSQQMEQVSDVVEEDTSLVSHERILETIEKEEEEDQEREARLLQEAISSVPEMDEDEAEATFADPDVALEDIQAITFSDKKHRKSKSADVRYISLKPLAKKERRRQQKIISQLEEEADEDEHFVPPRPIPLPDASTCKSILLPIEFSLSVSTRPKKTLRYKDGVLPGQGSPDQFDKGVADEEVVLPEPNNEQKPKRRKKILLKIIQVKSNPDSSDSDDGEIPKPPEGNPPLFHTQKFIELYGYKEQQQSSITAAS